MTALSDTPVVLLHGPRQCGKTSLAQALAQPAGYGYLTFDNDSTVRSALADPIGFLSDLPPRMVLDEIQRVPEIFTSMKLIVDRDRVAGRFLLTGSSNVLLLPKLADSLAGRLEAQRLYPLAQCEMARAPSGFLDALFGASFRMAGHERLGMELAQRIVAGGYPSAVGRDDIRRREWCRSYIQSLLQRDVRDLSRIADLDVLPRLLQLIASRTANLVNVSDLASPFQLSRTTIGDYVTLLERLFLIEALPAWHLRQINRLVKTPKLHIGDTGLACSLMKVDARTLYANKALLGQLLETFVFQEMRSQASWEGSDISFHHFRNRDDFEVDLVVERGFDELAGVEVKASATVGESDFRGLRKLREVAAGRFKCGVVLYDGDATLRFGADMFAVPVRLLWETPVH